MLKRTLRLIPILFILGLALWGLSCADTSGHVYENGAMHVGGDGEPIELVDNPNATNPAYEQLLAFIGEDTTDSHVYLEGSYVCSDFAETLHNNAEQAGIRAAWVGISFEGNANGHASNAFETTDRGLVYVDCTGARGVHVGDAIAYIEIGKEYGLISIDKASSLEYSFYQEYTQKWQEYEDRLEAYNREVEEYNQEISGKVYTEGSSELARIEAWKARLEEESQALEELAKELGDYYYEPLGIVKEIEVHW